VDVTGEADISAENINIGGREATTETTTHTKVETETLAIGVKNAYADTAFAIKAVADAAAALEDAKEDLDDAKRNVRNGTLAASALDDYKANLAAATAQLTQAGIAAVAAGATAAATTGTGGFYVSGSAEKSVTETTTTNTSSTFNGSSINLGSGKLNAENKIEVTGSAINVVDNLEINADDIIVKAGIEETTETSSETTRTAGATASYGASGASGGVNASGSNTDSESYSKTHINSSINAGSLNSTSDNLTLSGANVEVAGNIDIDTGNLVIESLQDESSSSSKTEGYNASASIGGDGKVAPGSFGANQNSSSSDSKWVNNQTTLIGGTSSGEMGEGDVNINADSTTITGATVASATRNEDGSLTDNSSSGTGTLNLATDELVINNLQDKDHSESEGFDVSGSSGSTTVGLTSNGHKTEQDTLATLGGGNITKKDGSEHDAEVVDGINSDLNNSQVITKDQQTGGLDATVTVDHRLLSGDGLKDIAEDFEETEQMVLDGIEAIKNTPIYQEAEVQLSVALNGLSDDQADIANDVFEDPQGALDTIIEAGIRTGDFGSEEAIEVLSNPEAMALLSDLQLIQNGDINLGSETEVTTGSIEVGGENVEVTGGYQSTALDLMHTAADAQQSLNAVAEQLGVDPETVMKVLTYTTMIATGRGPQVIVSEVSERTTGEMINAAANGAGTQLAASIHGTDSTTLEAVTSEEFVNSAPEGQEHGYALLQSELATTEAGAQFLMGMALGAVGGKNGSNDGPNTNNVDTNIEIGSQRDLPDNYSQNPDGTITGPSGGNAVPVGQDANGNTIYQRTGEDGKNGGFYSVENDVQQPATNPNPSDSTINEQREHHQKEVDQLAQDLESQGNVVVADGRVYHADGSGNYCKPDVCSVDSSGSATMFEVKTGNAGFTNRQREGFEHTGTDSNGNNTYRIPPDATVTGELAEKLGLESGSKVGELYPEGIPVIEVRRPGLVES